MTGKQKVARMEATMVVSMNRYYSNLMTGLDADERTGSWSYFDA